eukprot:6457945-Amphidinium_carterae.1
MPKTCNFYQIPSLVHFSPDNYPCSRIAGHRCASHLIASELSVNDTLPSESPPDHLLQGCGSSTCNEAWIL